MPADRVRASRWGPSPPGCREGEGRPASCALAAGALVLLVAGGVLAGAADAAETRPVRSERALPRFEGPLLGGGRAGTDGLQGRRALIFVFGSRDRDADRVAELVGRVREAAEGANVVFLGVSRDPAPETGALFASLHGLDFPVLHDRDFQISRKLGLPGTEPALLLVDGDGYIVYAFAGLEGDADELASFHEEQLREVMHLGPLDGTVAPVLGVLPQAPAFEVTDLGGASVTLAQLRGKVVVLIFFLPTCPHCHDALRFLDGLKRRLARDDFEIVAVSTVSRRYVIEEMVEDLGLSFVAYTDPGGSAQRDYAHRFTVPDMLVIDREGRVVTRRNGNEPRIEALITMAVRDALGVANPILLERAGYSGEELCSVCHRVPHTTWSLTRHAYAFESLVEHSADRDPDCLPCHTVGWEQPGGYSLAEPAAHLQGVQCESCHGRGGPHQSPQFAARGYEAVCLECHTQLHSLRFAFAERLPLVSHAANLRFSELSVEERRALIHERDVRERKLFESADYVGTAACAPCHSSEHELWRESAHAAAFDTLRRRGEAQNANCQACHTTGFGESSGWPGGGEALLGVGCESCHGPGGRHVAQGARRQGTILRLTEKCDSCVILQICGACHDEANDPGFEFELEEKLELVRHGFRDREAAAR